jgi:hypothetical protein
MKTPEQAASKDLRSKAALGTGVLSEYVLARQSATKDMSLFSSPLATRERLLDFLFGYGNAHAGALFLEQHKNA